MPGVKPGAALRGVAASVGQGARASFQDVIRHLGIAEGVVTSVYFGFCIRTEYGLFRLLFRVLI